MLVTPGRLNADQLARASKEILAGEESIDTDLSIDARTNRFHEIAKWERTNFGLHNPLVDIKYQLNWIAHDRDQWASTGLIQSFWWADYLEFCSVCNYKDTDTRHDVSCWRLAGTLMFFCTDCREAFLSGENVEILRFCGVEMTCEL